MNKSYYQAKWKTGTVETFLVLQAQGLSGVRAARRIGKSQPTLIRWRRSIKRTKRIEKLELFLQLKQNLLHECWRNEFVKASALLRQLHKLKKEIEAIDCKL